MYALGRNFDCGDPTKGEQQLHKILRRLFRGLFHYVAYGVGDLSAEGGNSLGVRWFPGEVTRRYPRNQATAGGNTPSTCIVTLFCLEVHRPRSVASQSAIIAGSPCIARRGRVNARECRGGGLLEKSQGSWDLALSGSIRPSVRCMASRTTVLQLLSTRLCPRGLRRDLEHFLG